MKNKTKKKLTPRIVVGYKTVLTEKVVPNLDTIVKSIQKCYNLSTEIIPYKGTYIIYQESIKGGIFLFGQKHPRVVIARIFVLRDIIKSDFELRGINLSSEAIYRGENSYFFIDNRHVTCSALIAIPASAKQQFIEEFGFKRINMEYSLTEEFPLLMIKHETQPHDRVHGTFLNRENLEHLKRYTLGHSRVSLFNNSVSLWNRGLWKPSRLMNQSLNNTQSVIIQKKYYALQVIR